MRRAPLLASAFLPSILCSSRAPWKAYTHLTSRPWAKVHCQAFASRCLFPGCPGDNQTFASLCELSASWEMRFEQGLLDSGTNAVSYCSPVVTVQAIRNKGGKKTGTPFKVLALRGLHQGNSASVKAGKLWIQSAPCSRDASSSPHARNRVIPKASKLAMVSRSHEG